MTTKPTKTIGSGTAEWQGEWDSVEVQAYIDVTPDGPRCTLEIEQYYTPDTTEQTIVGRGSTIREAIVQVEERAAQADLWDTTRKLIGQAIREAEDEAYADESETEG